MSRCLREVQSASERANSDMCNISREALAQGTEQERRLEAMHSGLTEFLQKCDPAHLPTTHHVDAPTASTPYTPTGISARLRRNLDSNHLQWARKSPWNPRAARCRTSGITTTSAVRAPGITTTFGTRASENTTLSGTHAPGITTTVGTRASENTTLSGTRAPGIMTTFGTRAPENTSMIGTRTPETYMTTEIDSTNDLHTKMTREIAVICGGILIMLELIHQCHARPQAPRFRHSTERYQLNSVHGLSNSRPLRAIRVGH